MTFPITGIHPYVSSRNKNIICPVSVRAFIFSREIFTERLCTSWLSRCATTSIPPLQYFMATEWNDGRATFPLHRSPVQDLAIPSFHRICIIDSCMYITCVNNVHLACMHRLRNKTGYRTSIQLENGWKLSRLDVLIFLYIYFVFIIILFLRYNVLSIPYLLQQGITYN